MKEFFSPFRKTLIIGIGLLLSFSAHAQERQYRDVTNPEKGYWQIFTNPSTNNTIIRFFDGKKQQVYEETIAGKYIKLTDRNIARINKTFDQVVSRTMVMAQVKSEPLTSSAFRKLTTRQGYNKKKEAENTPTALPSPFGLQVYAFQLFPSGKVELNVLNPRQKRILIQLKNQEGHNIYYESTANVKYKRSFSFEGMEYGQYQLVVSTADKKYKYSKKIDLKSIIEMLKEQQRKAQEHLNQNLANR